MENRYSEIGACQVLVELLATVARRSLSPMDLIPRNHSYLEESIYHHVEQ